MKNIQCLLVDDEPPALEILQSHISNIPGFEVAAMCKNGIEALDVLQVKPVDLIFLDIKMPKLIGTDFLKNLSHPPKVIFVTAYREYALDSYDLDAVDYLVKPVTFDRFLKAVYKVKRLMDHQAPSVGKEYVKNPEAFVYVRVSKSMQKILLTQISYIESRKDYVKIFLTDGEYYLARQSISSMENMLSAENFLRVHRSYMIALEKISGYNNNDIIIEGTKIPVGRLYKQQVMDIIKSRRH